MEDTIDALDELEARFGESAAQGVGLCCFLSSAPQSGLTTLLAQSFEDD